MRVQLKNNALAGYLKQRFTEHGHRVFRLLIEHKYLPIDLIEKIAMLGTRRVRTVLHVLFQHGYVTVQARRPLLQHAAWPLPACMAPMHGPHACAVFSELPQSLCVITAGQ